MKKFRFRLEKIKKLREDSKRRAQKRFAEAKRREGSERQKLRLLKEEIQLRRKLERGKRSKRVYPDRLKNGTDYILQLEFLIRHQMEQVALAENRTRECRAKLEEASREVKKLEKLEERKRDEYFKEYELYLQKENDEIGIQRRTTPI